MSLFLTALLTTSLTMSAVILLLLLMNKLLANKVSAVFRYYIWLIVLIGLLIPFRPIIPVPFEPMQILISFEAAEKMPDSVNERIQDETLQGLSLDSPVVSDVNVPVQTANQPFSSPAVIVFGVWSIGVLAVLSFHLWLYARFKSSVRRWGSDAVDGQVLLIFQTAKDGMGLSGNRISVKTCAFISSPMLIGFRSTAILLPEKEISPDELEHIFRHELTHYKHKDLWINLLILLVSAMHWFNPFIYLMAKTIRSECEAACDEAVVAGSDVNKRKHYAETIIGFVGAKSTVTPVLSTYFYGGSNIMKKRLFSIMDTGRKRKGLAMVCAAAITMMTLVASAAPDNTGEYIGEAKAKSIALEHAGISESQAVFIKAKLGRDDGRVVYDVKFYSGNTEYDYEIDAVSGSIFEYDSEVERYAIPGNSAQQKAQAGTDQYIGEAKAKSIALEHAGISESQAVFIKAKLGRDDGWMVYDVEFYSGNTEYDYEIDAVSGSIFEYDSEVEYDAIPDNSAQQKAQVSTDQYIGEAKAKSIALEHAGISESQAVFIKAKLGRDDGRMVYDIEFYSGNTEYDYEIDAVSGSIFEYDRKVEHDGITNNSKQQKAQVSADQYIGEAKAKSIALSDAGFSESQVSRMKVKLDREDGRMVYEAEFDKDRTEYEYEIDAISGAILKSDVDYDN